MKNKDIDKMINEFIYLQSRLLGHLGFNFRFEAEIYFCEFRLSTKVIP